jgi:hypothetical protein
MYIYVYICVCIYVYICIIYISYTYISKKQQKQKLSAPPFTLADAECVLPGERHLACQDTHRELA